MRTRHRGLAALLSAIAVTAAAAQGAAADDVVVPSPGSGSEVAVPGTEEPMDAQTTDKVEATLAFGQAFDQGDWAGALASQQAFLTKYGLETPDALRAAPTVTAALPTTLTVPVTQVGQSKNYWCGPASGFMIIRALNGATSKSAVDRTSLSQTSLASINHMQTEHYGLTGWTKKSFVTGINRWRGTNWYTQVNRPSATLLRAVFQSSIGGNHYPFAADTVEFASGSHYNGHPVNQTIGHWIVAYGYSGSGGVGYWADPSTSVWSTVKPKFSYSTTSFQKFVATNGIAY